MKLDSPKVTKVTKPIFEKILLESGGHKKSQILLKNEVFGGFDKNLIHSFVLFYLNMNVLMVS